jgi:hypothetical protein
MFMASGLLNAELREMVGLPRVASQLKSGPHQLASDCPLHEKGGVRTREPRANSISELRQSFH